MWAMSPLAVPVEALEEILTDIQTARPTATGTLLVGPMVGTGWPVTFTRKHAPHGCLKKYSHF